MVDSETAQFIWSSREHAKGGDAFERVLQEVKEHVCPKFHFSPISFEF